MSGGGGSGGGTQTSSTTTTQELSPQQKQLLGLTQPTFASYFNQDGTTNAKPYQGQTLAGTSPFQTLGQQMTLNNALGPVQDAVNATLKGTNFLTSGAALNPATNPGLQGTLDAATRQIGNNFQQQVMPAVRSDAVLAGGYGGNRQGIATSAATQQEQQQVGDTTANILNTNYQSGLDAMAKGLGFAPSNISAAFQPGTAVSGVGDIQQNQQQAQLNNMASQYYNNTFFPLSLAEEIAGVAMGMPGGSASSVSSQNLPSSSTSSNILSGLGGGASIFASLLPYLMGA